MVSERVKTQAHSAVEVDGFEVVGRGDPGLEAVAEERGEGVSGLVLAVVEDEVRRGVLEVRGPLEQRGLSGVGGESAEGVDLGAYGDGISPDADGGGAVDELSSAGPGGLVADDEDVHAAAPHVVAEVVEDSSAGAHAGAGDDDGGTLEGVEFA